MNEFNRTLQEKCAITHAFQYAKVKGFRYDPEGNALGVWQYLADGCHPRESERGFFKYQRELHNIIQRAKPALAQVMWSEGRLYY